MRKRVSERVRTNIVSEHYNESTEYYKSTNLWKVVVFLGCYLRRALFKFNISTVRRLCLQLLIRMRFKGLTLNRLGSQGAERTLFCIKATGKALFRMCFRVLTLNGLGSEDRRQ